MARSHFLVFISKLQLCDPAWVLDVTKKLVYLDLLLITLLFTVIIINYFAVVQETFSNRSFAFCLWNLFQRYGFISIFLIAQVVFM